MITPKRSIVCPYCTRIAQLVTGEIAVPRHKEMWSKRFWYCGHCNASVRAFPNGTPMGLLATPRIRYLRKMAHDQFDALWQDPKRAGFVIKTDADLYITQSKMRKRCYTWLADVLQMTREEAHFGMMTSEALLIAVAEMCRQADPAQIRARYGGAMARNTQEFRTPFRKAAGGAKAGGAKATQNRRSA